MPPDWKETRLTFKDSLRAQPTADQLGKRRLCSVYDWTSGFYPGSLWYAYELTGNDTLKTWAIQYTNLLNPVRYYTGTHDLGFMVNCSYGNAERLAPNDTIAAVMKETADNLCGRFNDSISAIRSWDFGTWNFPVIIDNMMNLDLLFNVAKATGNNSYKDIAVKHAMTTMNNHFRPRLYLLARSKLQQRRHGREETDIPGQERRLFMGTRTSMGRIRLYCLLS